jgi:two-component system, NarL family, nitrate/nitrite response regulator NarL
VAATVASAQSVTSLASIDRPLPRLLLVNDWPMLRDHLRHDIPEWGEFELVGAVSGADVLRSLELLKPDIALAGPFLEHSIGESEVLSFAEEIVRVVFISADTQPAVSAALSLGAAGYLTMDADKHELRAALKQVANNRVGLSAAAQRLRAQQRPAPYDVQRPSISKRERQVLRLMARGMASPEISERLFVSHSTVKRAARDIYRKLGAKTGPHAILLALRHKLI